MKSTVILARRYALAFIRVFDKTLTSTTLTHLEHMSDFIAQHKIIMVALKGPACTIGQQHNMLNILFKHFNLDDCFYELGRLLVYDRRIALLPLVLDWTRKWYMRYHNIATCTIKSSHQLHEKHRELLVKFTEFSIGKKILYNVQLDPTLIAGICLRGETFFWEHSVRRQLQRLQEPLMSRGFYEQY